MHYRTIGLSRMLRTARRSINGDIDCLVDNLLREDVDFERTENRSAHREHFVRSVYVALKGREKPLHAFSKNISTLGIGLITGEEIPTESAALTIEAIKGPDTHIMAECRWCKPFGKNWFVSGWQFVTILQR